MNYRSLISSACLFGGLVFGGQVYAADDAKTICQAAMDSYEAAALTGDSDKMAAVYSPNGEFVGPYGQSAGHDKLVQMDKGFVKPADKQVDTMLSATMIGDIVVCSGGTTFSRAGQNGGEKGYWTKVIGKVGGDWKLLNLTYAPAKN
jgi:hypothetical protein